MSANLMSTFLLTYFSHWAYYAILAGFSLIWGCLFLVIKEPKADTIKAPDIGLQASLKIIKGYFSHLENWKLASFFFYTGTVLAFYLGYLYIVIQDCIDTTVPKHEVNIKTAFVFLSLGTCQFIGGMTYGQLIPKLKSKLQKSTKFLAILVLIFTQIGLFFIVYSRLTQYYLLCFFVAGFYGLADTCGQSIMQALINENLDSNNESSGFARVFSGLGSMFYLLLVISLKHVDKYVLYSIMFALMLLTLFCLVSHKVPPKPQ